MSVFNGTGVTFLGGAPWMETPAATLSSSTNFITATPAIECPMTSGFSGNVSISFLEVFDDIDEAGACEIRVHVRP